MFFWKSTWQCNIHYTTHLALKGLKLLMVVFLNIIPFFYSFLLFSVNLSNGSQPFLKSVHEIRIFSCFTLALPDFFTL